ncbi:MAG: hypothetical protein HY785_10095 [Oscillatoriophycideae cyanobacterium NC_groundwater_1537_Pr4_S-0.65um_50_18]|nr:hypothetical protein [Oscillatoriophycideae cyanobacterium NC_groundwater_1537_Pr4_S-0.65um_50_18]
MPELIRLSQYQRNLSLSAIFSRDRPKDRVHLVVRGADIFRDERVG